MKHNSDNGKHDFNFSNIKTYPVKDRINLVTIENLANPDEDTIEPWGNEDFDELLKRIIEARRNNKPVIWFMGAH